MLKREKEYISKHDDSSDVCLPRKSELALFELEEVSNEQRRNEPQKVLIHILLHMDQFRHRTRTLGYIQLKMNKQPN